MKVDTKNRFSLLSCDSGPMEPSPKARIGNGSIRPRSRPGAWSNCVHDDKCDKATEPKLVDKDGMSVDEDGFWNDFDERRSFTTTTPPKKSKAEKRKEKKDRLKNIVDFPVFVPQKEDKEFVMKAEEFPTLEMAKTVKKTQVKKKESAAILCNIPVPSVETQRVPKLAKSTPPEGSEELQRMDAAPKGPHKERSGVPDETKKVKKIKKGKKVMKKNIKEQKKQDEEKQLKKLIDQKMMAEQEKPKKEEAKKIEEENHLQETLMEELNSMALVAKKNKDLIVEAEAFIARKMNRSFKKARRSERL